MPIRQCFDYASIPALTWFPGHMAASLTKMKGQLRHQVDYIIELRDARIPLSSAHPVFEELFMDKKRVLLFNKADLALPAQNKVLLQRFPEALLVSAKEQGQVRSLLRNIQGRVTIRRYLCRPPIHHTLESC